MRKLFLSLVLVASINITKAQNVLYTNVYDFSYYDLVHMVKHQGTAGTLTMYDDMLETNNNPLVIYDNGVMLGTDAFSSMADIREFISNLESARKDGYYKENKNYTLEKGPYGSVIAYIKGKGEMHFTKYLVKQLKKAIK